MEPLVLVILGAGIAHLSSVIMEYRRHRLDTRYGRTDRRQAFQVEQLLQLQDALIPLMERAWLQSQNEAEPAPPDPAIAMQALRIHRVLVLVDDDDVRQLTHAALAAVKLAPLQPGVVIAEGDWAAAHTHLQALNVRIGDQVRAVMGGSS